MDDKNFPVLRFGEKGREKRLGHLTWADLANPGYIFRGDDVRFQLFTGNKRNATNWFFVIDIDEAPFEYGGSVTEYLHRKLPFEFTLIFTGNGFHAYYPLDEGFSELEKPGLRQSYEAFCSTVSQELKAVFPPGLPFLVNLVQMDHLSYGRVPGSTNTKYNKFVEYVDGLDGDRIKSITEILHRVSDDEVFENYTKAESHAPLGRDVVFVNCSYVREVFRKIKVAPEDCRNDVLSIFRARGNVTLAREFAAPLGEEGAVAVKDFFEKPNVHPPQCGVMASKRVAVGMGSCKGCRHNVPGNSPALIGGPFPTPSRGRGFHPVNPKSGTILTEKISHDCVAGEFFNRNDGGLIRVGSEIYKYNGKCFEKYSEIKNLASSWSAAMERELTSISAHGVYSTESRNKLAKAVQALSSSINDRRPTNPQNLIAFQNGVLDIDNIDEGLRPHSPGDRITSILPVDYAESGASDFFHDWFYSLTYEEDVVELVQAFLGLSISSIPSGHYDQFLWCYGPQGSGKSTLLRMATHLVGEDAVIVKGASQSFATAGQGEPVPFVGKKVFYIDDLNLTEKMVEPFYRYIKPLCSGMMQNVKIPFKPVSTEAPLLTLLFSSNEPPPALDRIEGASRRLRTVHFTSPLSPERVAEMDAVFGRRERDRGLVFWAIDGLKKALKRRKETGHYLPPLTGFEVEVTRGEKGGGRALGALFFERHLDVREGIRSSAYEMKNAYIKWCREKGVTPLNNEKMEIKVIETIAKRLKKPYRKCLEIQQSGGVFFCGAKPKGVPK